MAQRKVEQTDRQEPTDVEHVEKNIGASMAHLFMRSDGFDKVLAPITQGGGNPNGPAGMLASQIVLNTRESMLKRNLLTSDRIWAAQGGVLDQVIDELHAKLPDFDPDSVKAIALQQMKMYDDAAKQAKTQPQGQPPATQAAPAAQQGGQPPMGGALASPRKAVQPGDF